MYCSKCGTQLADGAAFCTACGAPQAAVPAPVYSAPAAPPPHSPYAGFWLRVVAYIIDQAVMLLGVSILALIAVALIGIEYLRAMVEGLDHDDPRLTMEFVLLVVTFGVGVALMSWLYHAWFESSASQGTLGKMVLGLIVTDMEGRRITFARATGRFFAKIITGLIPFGIGYMLAGFTQKKQALHDMIASCLVLRKS